MTYSKEYLKTIVGAIYENPKTGVHYCVLNVTNLDADENRKKDYPTTIVYTDLNHTSVWSVTLEKWIEKDFTLLTINTMAELAPHQQRVVDEKNEVKDRLEKLHNFINVNPIYRELPVEEQEDLFEQATYMNAYIEVLERRISRF